MSELFAVLANDDRLALLQELRRLHSSNPMGISIKTLGDVVGLSRFSASRHLRLLRDAGLVDAERLGPSAMHRLSAAGFEDIEDWLYLYIDAVTNAGPSPHERL